MKAIKNVYKENGYKNRNHYLECLAEEYGVDPQTVSTLANLMGPNEDFDGLVSEVRDYSDEVNS
jgi:hypothetical protein